MSRSMEVDKKPYLIVSEIMLGCNIVYTFLLELKKLLLAPIKANGIKKMEKTQDVVYNTCYLMKKYKMLIFGFFAK